MQSERLSEPMRNDPERVVVHLPLRVLWDLDGFTIVSREILDRLGCKDCTSGFDIRYKGIRDFIVDRELVVRDVAGPLG